MRLSATQATQLVALYPCKLRGQSIIEIWGALSRAANVAFEAAI
jgi:hypothetical protein